MQSALKRCSQRMGSILAVEHTRCTLTAIATGTSQPVLQAAPCSLFEHTAEPWCHTDSIKTACRRVAAAAHLVSKLLLAPLGTAGGLPVLARASSGAPCTLSTLQNQEVEVVPSEHQAVDLGAVVTR